MRFAIFLAMSISRARPKVLKKSLKAARSINKKQETAPVRKSVRLIARGMRTTWLYSANIREKSCRPPAPTTTAPGPRTIEAPTNASAFVSFRLALFVLLPERVHLVMSRQHPVCASIAAIFALWPTTHCQALGSWTKLRFTAPSLWFLCSLAFHVKSWHSESKLSWRINKQRFCKYMFMGGTNTFKASFGRNFQLWGKHLLLFVLFLKLTTYNFFIVLIFQFKLSFLIIGS